MSCNVSRRTEGVLITDDAAALVEMDDKGLVQAWSPEAVLLFGYEQREALGAPLRDLIVPARLRAGHDAGLRRYRERGEAPVLGAHLDLPALRRDGTEIRVELVVTRDEDRFSARIRRLDTPPPLNGELFFKAELHQRRERVEAARLTALIESLNVGVLLEDEHQRVVLANSAFVELFALGLAPDMLRGAAPLDGSFTQAFADRAAVEQRVQETVRRGRPIVGDEARLQDGRVLERDYVPVILDGTTLGHLWVFRDVTAQAQIRRDLEERNRMLTELSELKTEFIRVASHELRTPLTSIATFAGMLELAEDATGLDAVDQHAAVIAIRRNAERMQLLVADLMLLAQLESADAPLDLVPVDLAAIVSEAAADVPASVTVDPGPTLRGDEDLLRQLFGTAIGVVAATNEPDAPPITVEASGDPRQWTVRVTTRTAAPVSAERLLSMRVPHPEAEGEHRTSALALMLARGIATRHGGEMLTSVDGSGVAVTIRLPV